MELEDYGTRGIAKDWFVTYLSNRKQFFSFNNILSPQLTLYLMVFHKDRYRDHCCSCTCYMLIKNWKCNLDAKQYVGVVALDLSKAFDSLPHELLLAKLQAYGVSKQSIQLIRNFLTKRRQRVKVFDKTSDWVETIRGIRQGSVLGPLLFNIFVNDLHFDLTNGEINTFADDNQLYTCHQNADTVEDTLNSDLEITLEWFDQNSLTANPNKFQSLGLAPGRSTIDLQAQFWVTWFNNYHP